MDGKYYKNGYFVDLANIKGNIELPYSYASKWTSNPRYRKVALLTIFNGSATYQDAVTADDLSFLKDEVRDSMLCVTTLSGMECAFNVNYIVSAEIRVAAFRKFYNESNNTPKGEYTGIWVLPAGYETATFKD